MGITDHAVPLESGAPEVTDELARWIWAESGTERATRERVDGATITYPGRNNALASLAGSMRRRGMTQAEIEAALIATNATRVEPPLDEADVRRIAKSVSRYEVADDVLKLVERGQSDPVYGDEITDGGITTMTLKQIAELPDPGYKPMLGPLVYRGLRTLVGAATGEGKTTLVMWMLRAIVEGEGFLGYQGVGPDENGKKPTVLIIDAEQSVPDIQRLANETGMTDSENIHYIPAPDGLNLGESTSDALQVERIIEQMKPDVVVVDPAYKVASIDSNSEREVVDLMRLFDRWRAEYGFAFIMPVHTRKGDKANPGGGPTLDDIFGSGAFSRGAEVILGVKQGEPGYSRLYVWKHRPGELTKGTHVDMAFDRESGFSQIYRESIQTVQQIIESAMKDVPEGLTIDEIHYRTGKSKEQVRKAISQSGGKILGEKVPGSKRKIYRLSGSNDEEKLVSDDDLERWIAKSEIERD
ncbi:MAG: AAA family ATPase [Actinomycetota bacterium]|nr:AAA family ATPase [Actinomycetota bacterium]